ncbi:MAG: hypothetical protein HOM16_14895 [Woeseia sp.]|jgi:hypothetical protein|nr:hypothetical protein [Woeseia sp.]
MKTFGYLLLAAGFLTGAYSTALDVDATNWTLFVPAAIAALVGVFLLKREASGIATSESVLTTNRAELTESLKNLVNNLDEIVAQKNTISIEVLRDVVDDRLRDDLRRFADARHSLVHLFSLQVYADIMSNFATGERYVNRVWSCSADGYDAEARAYLLKAAGQFRSASEQLEAVSS